jgi:hypothetical protein
VVILCLLGERDELLEYRFAIISEVPFQAS